MQNRLKTVKENQVTQTAQLQEVQAAIEAEKAERPESVRASYLPETLDPLTILYSTAGASNIPCSARCFETGAG